MEHNHIMKAARALQFTDLLMLAKSGDEEALLALLRDCEPLINKFAKQNGYIDPDLKQHLLVECIRAVKAFDPSRHYPEKK